MACIKTYDNKNKLRLLGWSSVKRDHSSPLSRNEQKMWQMADGRYKGRGKEEPMTYGDKKILKNETWREIWTEERDVKYTGLLVV